MSLKMLIWFVTAYLSLLKISYVSEVLLKVTV
jgi:hypothetical protein